MSTTPVLCLLSLYYAYYAYTMSTVPVECLLCLCSIRSKTMLLIRSLYVLCRHSRPNHAMFQETCDGRIKGSSRIRRGQ